MKCYPVIYTRTKQCDYYSKFHVLPDFVSSEWIYEYILQATSDMNPDRKNEKYIVLTNDNICVFGVIGFARDIVGADCSEWTRDGYGREVYGFYGFAVNSDNCLNSIPVWNNKIISSVYRKYIVPVWDETMQMTQHSEEIELEEKTPDIQNNLQERIIWRDTTKVFVVNDNLYETLLFRALSNKEQVYYCSELNESEYEKLENTNFNYVGTTENNIFRLSQKLKANIESIVSDDIPTEDGVVEIIDENQVVNPEASDEEANGSKKNMLEDILGEVSYKSAPAGDENIQKKELSDYLKEFNGYIKEVNENLKELNEDLKELLKKYLPHTMAVLLASTVVFAVYKYKHIPNNTDENKESGTDA